MERVETNLKFIKIHLVGFCFVICEYEKVNLGSNLKKPPVKTKLKKKNCENNEIVAKESNKRVERTLW